VGGVRGFMRAKERTGLCSIAGCRALVCGSQLLRFELLAGVDGSVGDVIEGIGVCTGATILTLV
jgi:hypothetical protein